MHPGVITPARESEKTVSRHARIFITQLLELGDFRHLPKGALDSTGEVNIIALYYTFHPCRLQWYCAPQPSSASVSTLGHFH